MISSRAFLRGFFVIATILSCCDWFDNACYAAGSLKKSILEENITNFISTKTLTITELNEVNLQKVKQSNANLGEGVTVNLCDEGQYLYKCGNYRVGFNWLKSANLPDPSNPIMSVADDPDTTRIRYKRTKHYYVADTIDELYEQMRKFFKYDATELLSYLDTNNSIAQAAPADYIADREAILNNLCHPSTTTVTCAICPNGAKVKASSVELDGDNLIIEGTWNISTFADCYMDEFEDSTGSYIYIPEGISFDNASDTDSAHCYYTNTNEEALDVLNGDAIGNFTPGQTNINTIKDFQPLIPSSGKKMFELN